MKLRNTTAQNCCIMLWYEERKQVGKNGKQNECIRSYRHAEASGNHVKEYARCET